MPAGGGTPKPYTTLAEGELSHRWPQVAPSGRAMVFTIWNDTGFEGGRIAVQRLDGSERKVLVQGGGYGRIVETPDGAPISSTRRPTACLPRRFDLDRLALTGAVTPINESVVANLSGGAHFAFSNTGHLVYAPGAITEASKTLLWVDRAGKESVAAEIAGPQRADVGHTRRPAADPVELHRDRAATSSCTICETGNSRRLTNGGFHGRPLLTS